MSKNSLIFNDVKIEVPFLAERDIKKHFSVSAHEQQLKLEEDTKIKSTTPAKSINPQLANLNQPKPAVGIKPNNNQQQSSAFSETDISKLTSLGFTRQQAVQALTICNGNADLAASYLFGAGF